MVRWLVSVVLSVSAMVSVRSAIAAEPSAAATAAFESYVRGVEGRLGQTMPLPAAEMARLRRGEVVVERAGTADRVEVSGAMLHHWRGTALVAGAKAADLERVLKDFGAYPRVFAPEVLRAGVVRGNGDHWQVTMRVRQKHVITVVMDTSYDVTFRPGESVSRSTRIAEIADAGTRDEHALSGADEHGFLWRQNTYWSYEERDGGLLMQIDSVSLSRAIPHGLAWAVGPFVESVPKESLEFTLRSVCGVLKR